MNSIARISFNDSTGLNNKKPFKEYSIDKIENGYLVNETTVDPKQKDYEKKYTYKKYFSETNPVMGGNFASFGNGGKNLKSSEKVKEGNDDYKVYKKSSQNAKIFRENKSNAKVGNKTFEFEGRSYKNENYIDSPDMTTMNKPTTKNIGENKPSLVTNYSKVETVIKTPENKKTPSVNKNSSKTLKPQFTKSNAKDKFIPTPIQGTNKGYGYKSGHTGRMVESKTKTGAKMKRSLSYIMNKYMCGTKKMKYAFGTAALGIGKKAMSNPAMNTGMNLFNKTPQGALINKGVQTATPMVEDAADTMMMKGRKRMKAAYGKRDMKAFDKAFANARKSGKTEFEFKDLNGNVNKYSTKLKSEIKNSNNSNSSNNSTKSNKSTVQPTSKTLSKLNDTSTVSASFKSPIGGLASIKSMDVEKPKMQNYKSTPVKTKEYKSIFSKVKDFEKENYTKSNKNKKRKSIYSFDKNK